MASLTEVKIARDASNEPIEYLTDCIYMNVKNMKELGLFDIMEYQYIKNIIHDDKKILIIYFETIQESPSVKSTVFGIDLQYDKIHVKKYFVTTKYNNDSWTEFYIKKLIKEADKADKEADKEADKD